MQKPSYDLRVSSLEEVKELFTLYHGYKSIGRLATYVFAVIEDGNPVAAFTWNPPPPGAAKSICSDCPHGVLSLSRMVAIPKEERKLRHISKPLKKQMKSLIDRTRWPVLVTYSDEGQGHTGYVYKVSGWTPTSKRKVRTYTDSEGRRVSSYSCGKTYSPEELKSFTRGDTFIQRWEHWICEDPLTLFDEHWEKFPIEGKVWKSGNNAYSYRKKILLDDEYGFL